MARTPGPRRPGYRPKIAGSRRNDAPQTPAVPEASDAAQTPAEENASAARLDESHPVVEASATDASKPAATDDVAPSNDTPVDQSPVDESPVDEKLVDEKPAATKAIAGADDADGTEGDTSGTDAQESTISLKRARSSGEAAAADSAAADSDSADDADAAPDSPTPTAKTRPVSRVSTIKPHSDASTRPKGKGRKGIGPSSAAAERGAAPAAARPNRTAQGWFSNRALAIIAGAAVLLGIVALVLGLHPGASIGTNKAFIDQAGTTDLTSQAQAKFCQVQAARSKDFDKWAASARTALTGEALTQFNAGVPTIKEQFGQQDVTNDCKVDAVGVRDLSGTSEGSTGQVVLNFVASGTANGTPTQSVIGRYMLTMLKRGDQWLIEKYGDI